MDEITENAGQIFNGIVEILFIISIFVSIKFPAALLISLVIAGVAIVGNGKMVRGK